MAVIDNLIAYWSLDEASGAALDAHGSNDLTETSGTIGTATGKVGGARDFEAGDTEYFSIPDNADLSTGDIDWSWVGWIQIENMSAFPVIANKGWSGSPGANSEWVLFYDTVSSPNRLVFSKRSASDTASVNATNHGALSTATWYFVVIKHDATNNLMYIRINNGTANTTSSSTGLNNGNGDYVLGASVAQALYWDGLIDESGFWKKLLTPEEETWLYNSGNGRSYADIVAEAGAEVEVSGALVAAAAQLAASVTVGRSVSAACVLPSLGLAAAVGIERRVAGALTVPPAAMAAAASIVRSASIAAVIPPMSLSAAVSVVRLANGAMALGIPVLAGSIAGDELVASVALVLPVPVIDADAFVTRSASGAMQLRAPVLDSDVLRVIDVSGVLLLEAPDMASQTAIARLASGALSPAAAVIAANAFAGAARSVVGLIATVERVGGFTASVRKVGGFTAIVEKVSVQ